MSDLNDIIGIDMKQYNITQSFLREGSNILQVPHQDVDLRLATDTDTVRITVRYSKGTLVMVYVSDLGRNETLPMRFPTSDPYGAAMAMLLRYQSVTGDNEYGAIVNGSFKNIKLKSSSTDEKGNANFMWVYCVDGVEAERKNICIGYEHGMLKFFMNNWPIYTIANTANNFNETQAQLIAVNFMKHYYCNYTFSNGTVVKVSNFSIVNSSYIGHTYLTFINSAGAASARGGDQTVFYLAWGVPMGFDRWYPGGVSIIEVILWADSGQVCSPAFDYSESDNQDDTSNASQSWITQSVFIAAVSGASITTVAVGILVYFKKHKREAKPT